ncbi:5-formyltetrahydrofolate cyclo-ligase [Sphingomonas sp.]|uniref:5-formyltetrahydrofolate cyclo-ligase n=1 Tax=Sphingomonas sp. TaxID=28214 RepID=UPI00286CAECF|nr:5-formyltetrahydrofolate cyclo-ligase [Sphingomonas sp.]
MVPSPPSSAASDKALLRLEARARRKTFVAGLSRPEQDELEVILADLLQPWIEKAKRVAAYHAIGSEIDPALVLESAMKLGCTTALPAFANADGPMIFRSGAVTEAGPHGIAQPASDAEAIIPDLVLVPLLAIDRRGTRLGQGGGHYDRALPALRAAGATIIGIGWAMQLVDSDFPTEPWDVPLDGFASPKGVTRWR